MPSITDVSYTDITDENKEVQIDLKVLSEQGYEVEKVCAVDQFSHSSHVETVVRLKRK